MVCIKKTAFPLDDVGLKEQIPLEISCTNDVVTLEVVILTPLPLSMARKIGNAIVSFLFILSNEEIKYKKVKF